MKSETNEKKNAGAEEGAALVVILIAMGLLALIVSLYTTSYSANMRAGVIVDSKSKHEKMERAFIDEIAGLVKNVDYTVCLDPKELKGRPFEFDSKVGKLNFVDKVNLKIPKTYSSKSSESTATSNNNISESLALALSKRCAKPVFVSGASTRNSSSNHIYFCLEFESPAEKGLKSYAEVAVDFKDPVSGAARSCEDFAFVPSTVAHISYGLYLNSKNLDTNLYGKKYGRVVLKSPFSP